MSDNTEEVKPKSVMIGTPMYGGLAYHGYVNGIINNILDLRFNGIGAYWTFIANESLITRGRNFIVDQFMKSECSHLMFIDADISFPEGSIRAMLEADKDIIAAPYPKKGIDWDRINEIVKLNKHIDEPLPLNKFGASYVINYLDNSNPPKPDSQGVVEVAHAGTGFMMIKRSALEKFDKAFPMQSYKPDHARTVNFDGSREIMAYFDCVICPDTKRYLSEDYMFCQWMRKAGGKIWLLPWLRLKHAGSYIFGGSLTALAAINASPTAGNNVPKKENALK